MLKKFWAWLTSGFKGVSVPAIEAIKTPLDEVKVVPVKRIVANIPKFGDDNADVLVLKAALKEQGATLPAGTSYFGKETKTAISNFQKKIGLAGSGVLGPKTMEALGIEVDHEVVVNAKLNKSYLEAKKYDGKKETDKEFSKKISPFWSKVGLNQYVAKGIAGASLAWCALFIGFTTSDAGQEYLAKRGAAAKSYDAYGQAVDWRKMGIPRSAVVRINSSGKCDSGSGNHVTYADGDCTLEDIKRGTFPGYGGNQGNQVKRSIYKVANICAVRWPKEMQLPGQVTKSYNCTKEEASNESTK